MYGSVRIDEFGRREHTVALSGTVTIGRTAENDIVLAVDGVSRCHAMLLAQPEGVFLLDLGSTNGTYVNGVQALQDEPVRLNDGDQITIGPASLHYSAPRSSVCHSCEATVRPGSKFCGRCGSKVAGHAAPPA
jgi:pSer/pThr/pTyr-binding forkhead associated (FHA) protein